MPTMPEDVAEKFQQRRTQAMQLLHDADRIIVLRQIASEEDKWLGEDEAHFVD